MRFPGLRKHKDSKLKSVDFTFTQRAANTAQMTLQQVKWTLLGVVMMMIPEFPEDFKPSPGQMLTRMKNGGGVHKSTLSWCRWAGCIPNNGPMHSQHHPHQQCFLVPSTHSSPARPTAQPRFPYPSHMCGLADSGLSLFFIISAS